MGETPAHSDETRGPAGTGPSPRVLAFAHAVIGVAIALAISQVVFGVQLHRAALTKVAPAVLAVLLAGAYRLKPTARVMLALTLAPVIPLVYAVEWRISRARPYDATAAARRGEPYDTRSLWEAVLDTRREGKDAQPSLQPRALLTLDLSKGLFADEIGSHTLSPTWGVEVEGTRVLPLGGVSGKHIVTCNEGGRWASYKSDEHGFDNPEGIWTRDTIDVAMLGDSFTQASCVAADENAAHWIRQRYPATLNLGMAGNGPLLELAGLEELVAAKKPRIVLWVYYNNDMADLDVERDVPVLRRYLDEDGFSQGLARKQAQIDEALLALSSRIEALSPRWPGWLDGAGITRPRAPTWLGDLVMGETHASTAAVLRLDRISWGITSRFVVDYLHAAPDLPLFKRVLSRAKQRVESWGGKLYVVYMADMFLLQFRGKREHQNRPAVLALVNELGIPLIDAHAAFLAVPDLETIRFHPEGHCNPAGYKLLADVVLRGLEGG